MRHRLSGRQLGRDGSARKALRRLVFSRVADAKCVDKLFTVIGPRFAKTQRPGGYTRILKCGFRHSDAAPMAYVIFSDTADLEKIADKKDEGAETVEAQPAEAKAE